VQRIRNKGHAKKYQRTNIHDTATGVKEGVFTKRAKGLFERLTKILKYTRAASTTAAFLKKQTVENTLYFPPLTKANFISQILQDKLMLQREKLNIQLRQHRITYEPPCGKLAAGTTMRLRVLQKVRATLSGRRQNAN
jgi:hypothetical protein